MTLSITVSSVIMLYVVIQSVTFFINFYAEYRYAECRYAECRGSVKKMLGLI